MDASARPHKRSFALGLENLGLLSLAHPVVTALMIVALSVAAGFGLMRLKVTTAYPNSSGRIPRNSAATRRSTGAFHRANTMCCWSWRVRIS